MALAAGMAGPRGSDDAIKVCVFLTVTQGYVFIGFRRERERREGTSM